MTTLTITLSDELIAALRQAAERELRTPQAQASWILSRSLRSARSAHDYAVSPEQLVQRMEPLFAELRASRQRGPECLRPAVCRVRRPKSARP